MELSEAAGRYLAGEIKDPEVLATLQRGSDTFGRDYFLLYQSLKEAGSLRDIPPILKRIIKSRGWKKWRWIDREFTAKNLAEYLTKPPPAGIGADLDMVQKVISDDHEALALFRQETTGKPGGNRQSKKAKSITCVTSNGIPKHGTKAYWDQRLREERNDLFERVKAGKLSTNAAAREANWIKQPTPLEQLRKAWTKASAEEQQTFLKEITRLSAEPARS